MICVEEVGEGNSRDYFGTGTDDFCFPLSYSFLMQLCYNNNNDDDNKLTQRNKVQSEILVNEQILISK